MNTKIEDRAAAKLPRWADVFPYVNGGLFSGSMDVPRFSRIARSYLLHIGNLDWTKINPDIFGSMIQAVADDEERGALGMHYTSVPNILKVLNPLFLDDLRHAARGGGRTIPACCLTCASACRRLGLRSGLRLGQLPCHRLQGNAGDRGRDQQAARRSRPPHRNPAHEFSRHRAARLSGRDRASCSHHRGISVRCALSRSEGSPCGVSTAGAENWITCGNALRLDWLSICPPTGTASSITRKTCFSTPLDQAQIDFENEGGETYICGNPPYLGSTWQNADQKADIRTVFEGRTTSSGFLDYVAGWFIKAADYGSQDRRRSCIRRLPIQSARVSRYQSSGHLF